MPGNSRAESYALNEGHRTDRRYAADRANRNSKIETEFAPKIPSEAILVDFTEAFPTKLDKTTAETGETLLYLKWY